jgi:hypothetical protein
MSLTTRMNGQGRKQFMVELLPFFLSLRCVGTGRTLGQFDRCDDGDAAINNSSGCNPPTTWYFPTSSYCNPTASSNCVGFVGATGSTVTSMPLALADYHGYKLLVGSTGSFFHNKASDGTDMGVIIPSLDAGQTTNLYVCTSSCGSIGPYPDQP